MIEAIIPDHAEHDAYPDGGRQETVCPGDSQPEGLHPAGKLSAAAHPSDAPLAAARMARVPQAMRVYTADELAALLPLPAADAHKYSRGKLAIVGGSAAYPGAACLAAAASQRAGAGYTEVLCARESVATVRAWRPSLVVRPWEGLAAEDIAPSTPGRPVAYAVGCGMEALPAGAGEKQGKREKRGKRSKHDAPCANAADCGETERLVHLVLKRADAPVLVDGGGLSALASAKSRRLLRRRFVRGLSTVITPHAGEAARLAAALNLPTDDPCRLACLLSLALGVVAVVKGPETFISNGEVATRIADGTPALAKAGTGDVLAGVMGAFLAQGMAAYDAVVLAVTLHARAGAAAARRFTDIGVTAEDVIEALPDAILEIAEAPEKVVDPAPGLLRRLTRR